MSSQPHSLSPRAPLRPLEWPDLVVELARLVADAGSVYLVGGAVRDALLGRAVVLGLKDVDLSTGGDPFKLARALADGLGGGYFKLDAERGVGRVVLDRDGVRQTLDVAIFRGPDLLADLEDRDFTVNAMAVSLGELDKLVDPLGGEVDLLRDKVLRLCAPGGIASDPLRALRAIRLALQFRLRLDRDTREATRAGGRGLVGPDGDLVQPERARGELFKMLDGGNPHGAVRLLDQLGLLDLAFPGLELARLPVLEQLSRLLLTISPARDDNTAANLLSGLAVMVLDRHRAQLQEHLAVTLPDERTLRGLLAIAALVSPAHDAAEDQARRLRLSNAERRRLSSIVVGHERFGVLSPPISARDIHRYFRDIREAGIDAALLGMAAYLSEQQPAPNPEAWTALLDEVVSPLLDGFFRRHQQVVQPPPLLTGADLVEALGLERGPKVGKILARLLEEQAAGAITSRQQALDLANRLAANGD